MAQISIRWTNDLCIRPVRSDPFPFEILSIEYYITEGNSGCKQQRRLQLSTKRRFHQEVATHNVTQGAGLAEVRSGMGKVS